MTEPTTRAREAGSRLNAEVAQALGWRAWKEKRGDYSLCVQVAPGVREPWLNVQKPEPSRYLEVSCIDAQTIGFFGTGFPNFSSDVSAAFLVVEAMRAKGWRCTIELLATGESPMVFVAFHDREQMPFKGHTAMEHTAAHAICRAALKALAASSAKSAVPETQTPVSPASL